jgi:hypothetical protein
MENPNKYIEDHMKVYATYSDEKLKIIMQKNNAWGDLHIAAKLVLESRKKKEGDIKHAESIRATRKSHKIAILAIIVSSLLALIFFLVDRFLLPSQNSVPKNISKTSTEPQKTTPVNPVPNQSDHPATPDKQQIKKQTAK